MVTVEYLRSKAYLIKESKMVVMDTNIPEESIEYVVDLCNKVNWWRIYYEFRDTLSRTERGIGKIKKVGPF